jgi:hypothetical protein
MKYWAAVLSVIFFGSSIANAQDEKKNEIPAATAKITNDEAVKMYYEFGGQLNTAVNRVYDGTSMFLAQMAIMADHSTVFSDEDKKLLDEAGIALFSYTHYYDEIVTLLPPNLEETPEELVRVFSDEKRLARTKVVVEAMTVLSASITVKVDALLDKIPSSDRLERWMAEAKNRYEAAK